MLKILRKQGLTEGPLRARVEQHISSCPEIYSVEDDNFLYYLDGRIFHIVRGRNDYHMPINDWREFQSLMSSVTDEFFVTGEGKAFTDSFLGYYLSRYNRRKEFISEFGYIMDDAETWA